jgi:aromatic ring hydroxylase
LAAEFHLEAGYSPTSADHAIRIDPIHRLTPQLPALDRVKLFKLVGDLVGSEFAGRHQQYEKFYAGASFIVRNHSYREAPWDEFHNIADNLLAS